MSKDNPYFCNQLKAYNKHIALFLLAVLSAFIVPKEFVHAFYGHTDTIHAFHQSDSKAPVVENEHEHCEILNFNIPLYFQSLNFFTAPEIIFSAQPIQQVNEVYFASHIGLSSLRAPPLC